MLRQLVHDNTTAKVKLSFKSERLLKPRMPLMLFIVALPLPQRGCGTTFKYDLITMYTFIQKRKNLNENHGPLL